MLRLYIKYWIWVLIMNKPWYIFKMLKKKNTFFNHKHWTVLVKPCCYFKMRLCLIWSRKIPTKIIIVHGFMSFLEMLICYTKKRVILCSERFFYNVSSPMFIFNCSKTKQEECSTTTWLCLSCSRPLNVWLDWYFTESLFVYLLKVDKSITLPKKTYKKKMLDFKK